MGYQLVTYLKLFPIHEIFDPNMVLLHQSSCYTTFAGYVQGWRKAWNQENIFETKTTIFIKL